MHEVHQIAVTSMPAASWAEIWAAGMKLWLDVLTSFGTIGAVVVALSLASRGRRDALHERSVRAGLAAADAAVYLASVRIDLGVAVDYMAEFRQINPNPRQFDAMCEEIQRLRRVDIPREQLVDLSPLPDDCSERIAASLACIRLVHDRVIGRLEEVRHWPSAERVALIQFCHAQLKEAWSLLGQAHDICAAATKVKIYSPDA